jgi:hypothetical protein
VRIRCSDSTYLKLEGVRQDIEIAIANADGAGTPVAGLTVEAVADAVAERLAGEVSAAVGEAFAAQQPAA